MHKLVLAAAALLLSLQSVAQNTTRTYRLYIDREINGERQVIDTSFSSREALEKFRATLPEAQPGKDRAKARTRVYRSGKHPAAYGFVMPDFPATFDFESDTIFRDLHVMAFSDSALVILKKQNDSLVEYYRHLAIPSMDSLRHFRMEYDFPDEEVSAYFFTHPRHKVPGKPGARKTLVFETITEPEIKSAPGALALAMGNSRTDLDMADLKVFPNPGDGLVQLSFRVGSSPAQLEVQVFDSKGQLVFSETDPGVSGLFLTEIDLRNAGRGTYYFVVRHGKKVAARKLILH